MRSYVSQLHLALVVVLVVLTAALAVLGWELRPSSSGFSLVPTDLGLYVTKAPAGLSITETMASAGTRGVVLTLSATGIPDVPQEGPWTLVVDNLGDGHLCTPSVATSNEGGTVVRLAPQHLVAHPAIAFV